VRGRMAAGVLVAVAGMLAPVAAHAGVPRAATPAIGYLPSAPGTGLARNHDSEPGAGVEPNGTLWATSTVIHDPRGGGQDIWKSTDRGRSWQWVAAPF